MSDFSCKKSPIYAVLRHEIGSIETNIEDKASGKTYHKGKEKHQQRGGCWA